MAGKQIGFESDIGLGLNELKDVVIDVLDTAPNTTTDSRAKEGRVVSYNGSLYIGDGERFVLLQRAIRVTDRGTYIDIEYRNNLVNLIKR